MDVVSTKKGGNKRWWHEAYGVMEASSGNDDHTHGAMKGEKMEEEKMKGNKEKKNIWEKNWSYE